jgi:hypothetical protein
MKDHPHLRGGRPISIASPTSPPGAGDVRSQRRVVETVVRTLWEALEQRGQRGTRWTIMPGQVGHAGTRWYLWDGRHSPHNPEVGGSNPPPPATRKTPLDRSSRGRFMLGIAEYVAEFCVAELWSGALLVGARFAHRSWIMRLISSAVCLSWPVEWWV